jgi:type IV pilus assembly protein PilY1
MSPTSTSLLPEPSTMTRRALPLLLALLFALPATLPSGVSAQDGAPDIRDIRPVVMLLVDTSGSMERTVGGPDAPWPVCTGSPSIPGSEMNRWAFFAEALTGSFDDYYCTAEPRTSLAFYGEPDFDYYAPYHALPGREQSFSGTIQQANDGILDVYLDRIKFGLMTFDSVYTFADVGSPLLTMAAYNARLGDEDDAPGGFSFGPARELRYDNCADTFMVNAGARRTPTNPASPHTGALISVGSESDDPELINELIQETVLSTRPHGGTPTAAMLEDLGFYLTTHPDVAPGSDPYADCRPTFALVLTDGAPDADFRDGRYDCEAVDGCPYPTADEAAADLCELNISSGACEGEVDGVFVVAFDVSDTGVVAQLNDIARRGGTDEALFANDRAQLLERLGEVLDRAAPGTTTRATPLFVTAGGGLAGTGPAAQYEFNAGFQIGGTDEPWRGILERTRFQCNGLLVEEQEIEDRDRFHVALDNQCASQSRTLLTVLTEDPADMGGNLVGDSTPLINSELEGTVRGLQLVELDESNTNLTPSYFGLAESDTAGRSDLLAWLAGAPGTVREDRCLGDIYHSSPVAVTAPRTDIADEAYNQFRRRVEVAGRPTVVYVGTNDGLLHAFAAEDFTRPDGSDVTEGTELWAFMPPVLMGKLQSAASSHQFMLDGTAVVRDVFFGRLADGTVPTGDAYHTVMIMGFRAGAPGYFAMDVTDPLNPEFLWQITGESGVELGPSYGQPAMAQVLVELNLTLQERAVAILPGGGGNLDEAAELSSPTGCTPSGAGAPAITTNTAETRQRFRCWEDQGRLLYFIDIETGELIRELGADVFNAPLVGSVSVYPGDIGTVAERAFLTDSDGVIWRVDFSSADADTWEATPFHDIFFDAGPRDGQPALPAPLITTDSDGQLVVLQATGDIDRLDGVAPNRVVSLTEARDFDETGQVFYSTALNWEIRLQESEQVTGALELFEGTVYFASFWAGADPGNACNVGESRIWGVAFREDGGSAPAPYLNPTGRFPAPRFEGISGDLTDHFRGPFSDQLILGVGVTQRPSCVEGSEVEDPYIGPTYQVTDTGGGTFQLRALVSSGSRAASIDGSEVASITEILPSPASYSSVQGFAGRVDF